MSQLAARRLKTEDPETFRWCESGSLIRQGERCQEGNTVKR
jgi:hypothetical protein